MKNVKMLIRAAIGLVAFAGAVILTAIVMVGVNEVLLYQWNDKTDNLEDRQWWTKTPKPAAN